MRRRGGGGERGGVGGRGVWAAGCGRAVLLQFRGDDESVDVGGVRFREQLRHEPRLAGGRDLHLERDKWAHVNSRVGPIVPRTSEVSTPLQVPRTSVAKNSQKSMS